MKPLSMKTKVTRFLCGGLVGHSGVQAIIYFAQESNLGMIYLTIFIFAIFIVLLINTWHN